jgi:ABC-type amino acid transport substrate-binding protein
LPYSFFNTRNHLVGMDVELMHRLAVRLQVRLEFVPYEFDTVVEQLEAGEIDVALGGLTMQPERLLIVGFSEPYQTATVAVILPDHRRGEFKSWIDPYRPTGLRLGTLHEDVAATARRELTDVEIVSIESARDYFTRERDDLDGLIMAAEEGAAWNVLYPEHAVVVPRPVLQRPVGMAVRPSDDELLLLLNRWLDFERLDGSLEKLRTYWIEGGGAEELKPRWCVLRDVLGWLP